jgi:hypothetical protein
MAKSNNPNLLRIREALSDVAAYGQVNWEGAELGQAKSANGDSVWRLKIVKADGSVELHDFTDDVLKNSDKLREQILMRGVGPAPSNPRLSDPKEQRET